MVKKTPKKTPTLFSVCRSWQPKSFLPGFLRTTRENNGRASEVIESNAFIGFENLQKTAISLLSAPAGNGGVEATGSVIKRVVNPQTNRMSDEHIEMWIVVRSYIKSKMFNFQQMTPAFIGPLTT